MTAVARPKPERPWTHVAGVLTLHLRLTPKGGRDSFDGFGMTADGKTHALARVRAVPEDGAANAALIVLLAKTLGLKKTGIAVVSGQTARQKTLRMADGAGLGAQMLENLWHKGAPEGE